MKNLFLIICLVCVYGASYAFDTEKWREYSKLRYAECAAGNTSCINRVHQELMTELDTYEKNMQMLINQSNFNILQDQLNTPRQIKYGYNAVGDYVPVEY